MPELPEVETIARGLRKGALGECLTGVEVRHRGVLIGSAEEFASQLQNQRLVAVRRKGKVLAVELRTSNGGVPRYLVVRLGMTGQFTVVPRHAPVEPHTHVRLLLGGGKNELRFRDIRRFGRLRCCTREELEAVLRELGPDAQEMTEEQFLGAMRGRRGAIKSWLMNQRLLAGLGNIYADEALFAAGIHPLAQPRRISRQAASRLFKAVRKVLDRAVRLGGTTFSDYLNAEGRPGAFLAKLRVYQRTGEACRRCRQAIRRIVIAGRSCHFCPRCQPRPRNVASMRGPRN